MHRRIRPYPFHHLLKVHLLIFILLLFFLARDCECHSGGCWVITSVDCSVKFCSFWHGADDLWYVVVSAVCELEEIINYQEETLVDPEPSMDPVWTRFSLEAFILRWEEIIHSCRVQNQEQSAEYEVQSKTSRRKKCRNQKPSPSQCHLVHIWTAVSTAAIPLCPLTAVRHYRCWISSSTPTSAVLLASHEGFIISRCEPWL